MNTSEVNRLAGTRAMRRGLPLLLALLAVAAWMALAPRALAGSSTRAAAPAPAKLPASATLQECVTSSEQTERSVTFAGEMTALKGATKMEMRVDVLERAAKDIVFHTVFAPGLGVWRTAAPGVSSFKYLKEITNLAAPASYRAVIRFRWMNAKGRLVRSFELRTPRCVQPLSPRAGSGSEEAPPASGAGSAGV